MSSERIDRLEERLVWLQRHVTEQDKVMLELSDELARLRAFELEFNQLVRKHFPHWEAKDISKLL